ncbi:hypothetical protein J4Q44_G00096540 [Coregonus suidteri]|uniref:Cadherin domain-containing protein n=1 Tax=Coregonus suidteri TaxID=861788 RepID=A0AAN8M758_9TELE
MSSHGLTSIKALYSNQDLLPLASCLSLEELHTACSRYRMDRDPAKWLDINSETGMIKTKHPLDRESPFVKDGKYRVHILAIESDEIPATGTGTILIELEDCRTSERVQDVLHCPNGQNMNCG